MGFIMGAHDAYMRHWLVSKKSRITAGNEELFAPAPITYGRELGTR